MQIDVIFKIAAVGIIVTIVCQILKKSDRDDIATIVSLAGLIIVGLGCAPIYPSIIHATPARFGAARSQALIGLEMAGAYVGTLLMPPLFGLIAEHITTSLLPLYLLAILAVMFAMNEHANRVTGLVRPAKPARERA